MKTLKPGLLPRIIAAIAAGILCGLFLPEWAARIFMTFNGIFGNFLGFLIPLLIFGLVAPGIAELGRGAGRLLTLTVALAYGFTIFAGFFTYMVCSLSYPALLSGDTLVTVESAASAPEPYFTVAMPPLMDVMTALILAFVAGLGMARTESERLRGAAEEFRRIIDMTIGSVIIPLLPIYIFGIFLSITMSGQVAGVLGIFVKIIAVILGLTVAVLLVQFAIAGAVSRRNPLRMLRTMLTAYVTALGTQSSAATIPVTLARTKALGVRDGIAEFTVPLCATIHLSGSMLKITSCAMAIIVLQGHAVEPLQFAGFIFMLAVTMVAAPGVPGGAIMAALGVLQSMLGFDEEMLGLMIAIYIALDSFGTATNVTGDGAVAVIVDRLAGRTER